MSNVEPIDKAQDMSKDGNIFVPIGHYAISNLKASSINHSSNFSIYGLGSCIALILFDNVAKVSAISHILLPKPDAKRKIKYPHKYANLSVKLLLEELIKLGAAKKNIKALVVGGSKIFDFDINIMGKDNISTVKEELEVLKIPVIKEDIGGSKGRNIIFDTTYFSLYVKSAEEVDFKRIN
ncbi:MAG: chemotaxis protein CheD [Promethearchaeota archaeon]